MPARSWSVVLDGDSWDGSIFVDSHGRVIVSTTMSIESVTPDSRTSITRSGSATTYVSVYAHRAYAIEPDGSVAWSVEKARVLGEAPDGTYFATDDRGSHIVLGREGREIERRASRTNAKLIAWDGAEPIFAERGCWLAPHVYTVVGHELRRYDRAGNLVAATAIPRDLFEAQCSKRPDLAQWPKAVLFPSSAFDLMYQSALDRFIGSYWGLLAWVMCVRPDGVVEWVRPVTEGCCNTACFVDATIAHASSCSSRLTFLSIDGAVIQAHDVPQLTHCLAFDHVAYAVAMDGLHAFDARGERLWRVEVADLSLAAAGHGAVYTLSGYREPLRLSAFAT